MFRTLTLTRNPEGQLLAQQEASLQDICDAFHEAELTEAEKLHVIALEEQ